MFHDVRCEFCGKSFKNVEWGEAMRKKTLHVEQYHHAKDHELQMATQSWGGYF